MKLSKIRMDVQYSIQTDLLRKKYEKFQSKDIKWPTALMFLRPAEKRFLHIGLMS